ncbi:hypothetical protein IF1G_02171 [Cordyceps javanica]|uniref:Uncharacterized protein n=1 Tax=Cordyceps javanica TaxID=43265 RepID=A0A545VDZ7_9HYPO|nr:hypothetical protein IF1G_02171 [Cordyceps javanica]
MENLSWPFKGPTSVQRVIQPGIRHQKREMRKKKMAAGQSYTCTIRGREAHAAIAAPSPPSWPQQIELIRTNEEERKPACIYYLHADWSS